jgi:hypothetical protein
MVPVNASVEESVLDLLQRTGPCSLDDLVVHLPNYCWSQVFLAVDRMSREDLLRVRRLTSSTYFVALSLRPSAGQLPSQ